jgi:RNA polymerase sigma-70 factor (ECF subfamily)
MQSDEWVWREVGLRSAVLAGDERAWRAWYDEAFANWLRGIAANRLRNYWRERHHRNGRLSDKHVIATPADAGIVKREQAQRIAQALAQLPERQEAALRAKYLDSQSVTEIAEEWGETPKAVESLLTRARQAFREAYQPDE